MPKNRTQIFITATTIRLECPKSRIVYDKFPNTAANLSKAKTIVMRDNNSKERERIHSVLCFFMATTTLGACISITRG